jgi:hypothetical protein
VYDDDEDDDDDDDDDSLLACDLIRSWRDYIQSNPVRRSPRPRSVRRRPAATGGGMLLMKTDVLCRTLLSVGSDTASVERCHYLDGVASIFFSSSVSHVHRYRLSRIPTVKRAQTWGRSPCRDGEVYKAAAAPSAPSFSFSPYR